MSEHGHDHIDVSTQVSLEADVMTTVHHIMTDHPGHVPLVIAVKPWVANLITFMTKNNPELDLAPDMMGAAIYVFGEDNVHPTLVYEDVADGHVRIGTVGDDATLMNRVAELCNEYFSGPVPDPSGS